MTQASCPKCGNHYFELVENEPMDSNFKYFFIQCSECGTVVGVTEFFNAGYLLKEQEKSIKNISEKLGSDKYTYDIITLLNMQSQAIKVIAKKIGAEINF